MSVSCGFRPLATIRSVGRKEIRRRVAVNLIRLREDRELTQAALAERLGWSRARVSRVERGLVDLDGPNLDRLADAVGTDWSDLYSEVRPLRTVRFCSGQNRRGRSQVLTEVSRWIDAYCWLEAELNDRRRFAFEAARGVPEPAAAAQAARRATGLRTREPIADLCGLLEANGVKVLRLKEERDSFFGMSVGETDGGPAVVVNTWDRIAVERWIFTAAHELGHLLLHPADDAPDRPLPAAAESEADAFAAEFLMPEAAFAEAWEAGHGQWLVPRVLKVKRIFRVSARTVLGRLVTTGRADEGVWPRFQADYRKRYGKPLLHTEEPEPLRANEFAWDWKRRGEPTTLSRHDRPDGRLLRLVRKAVEADLLTIRRVAEILGLHYGDAWEWMREYRVYQTGCNGPGAGHRGPSSLNPCIERATNGEPTGAPRLRPRTRRASRRIRFDSRDSGEGLGSGP